MAKGFYVYVATAIRGLGGPKTELSKGLETILETIADFPGAELIGAHAGVSGQPETLTDQQIYERDMDWLAKTDCLIADVSKPSLGVGYEIAIAQSGDLPILATWWEGLDFAWGNKAQLEQSQLVIPCSAMIRGNHEIRFKAWSRLDILRGYVTTFLRDVQREFEDEWV